MSYRNGFYSAEDLIDILAQIRAIVSDYKQRKHEMSAEDVISFRDDLSVLRVQLGDIESDLFDEKLGAELSYDNFIYQTTEDLVREFNPPNGKKIPYAEDKAKRQAKLKGQDKAEEMNKAKSAHRKAYVLVQHTLQDVLNAMSSRIQMLLKGAGNTPTGQNSDNRPIYEDPYQKHWGKVDDTDTERALNQVDDLESDLL